MTEWKSEQVELTLEGVDVLDIEMVAGEVTVTAGNGPARVEGHVRKGQPLEVHFDAGRLSIRHHGRGLLDGLPGARTEAVVSVVVPEATRTAVKAVSADVFVAGLTKQSDAATVSGAVTANALDGDVALRSTSGRLDGHDVHGRLEVDTVSGETTITGVGVRSVRAHSVSGDMTLDLDAAAAIDCTTVSGSVAVRLPGGSALDVEVATVSGRLQTTFPTGDLDRGRRRLRGRVGGGGERLTVRTTSGDFTLLERPLGAYQGVPAGRGE